nr:hypothetical protein [Actinomycetota bacterium]
MRCGLPVSLPGRAAIRPVRELLQALEQSGEELGPPLAYLAGRDVALGEGEVRAALRRAELLIASGGDPRRELELDGRAVSA